MEIRARRQDEGHQWNIGGGPGEAAVGDGRGEEQGRKWEAGLVSCLLGLPSHCSMGKGSYRA